MLHNMDCKQAFTSTLLEKKQSGVKWWIGDYLISMDMLWFIFFWGGGVENFQTSLQFENF